MHRMRTVRRGLSLRMYYDEGVPGLKVKVFPPHGCDRSALDERGWVEMPEGSRVSDMLKIIKCSPVKAKLLLVSVNGVRSPFGRELKDGDVVGFFAPVTGG